MTSFSIEKHGCVHITNADFVSDNVHGGSKENFVGQKDKEILDLRQRNWKKKLPVHTMMDTADILLEPLGMKRKDRDKKDRARLEIENSKKQKLEKEAIVLGQTNQYFKLELSGAWELTNISNSQEGLEGQRSQVCLPYGD